MRKASENRELQELVRRLGEGCKNRETENYTAKLAIGSKDGQTYYDHALTEIEKSNLIDQIDLVKAEVYGDKAAISDIKDKRLISILQTDASKVIDPETGEPMVMYHGTQSGVFTKFYTDGRGKTVKVYRAMQMQNTQ